MNKSLIKSLLLVILFSTIFSLAFLIPISVKNESPVSESPIVIDSKYSTNPSSPVTLSDGGSINENYDQTNTKFYYKSYAIASEEIYLISLQHDSVSDDFELHLYLDNYTRYKGTDSNSFTSHAMKWILGRYNSTGGVVYPIVETNAITGNGKIRAQSPTQKMAVGMLYSTNFGSGRNCCLYSIDVEPSTQYTCTLTFPIDCDFDLYMQGLSPGWAGYTAYAALKSNSSVVGQMESISFQTPINTNYDYGIVIIRKSGSDSAMFELKVALAASTTPPIPGFEIIPILMGLIFVTYFTIRHRQTKIEI